MLKISQRGYIKAKKQIAEVAAWEIAQAFPLASELAHKDYAAACQFLYSKTVTVLERGCPTFILNQMREALKHVDDYHKVAEEEHAKAAQRQAESRQPSLFEARA